jgi:predicted transglutaminase-like cysteine proteinase
VADVWTSPLKTIAAGQGDCEDYALAKLAALREAGVAEEELRLMVIHETGSESYHAVAAVRLEGRWTILDNRRLALLTDSAIDAQPIGSYAFGESQSDPNFAFASGASESAQSFDGWTAQPLLM